jgi:hypothetical protein
VRYSAGLAIAAFLFSLGASSLLYGLIYALVPLLWMAREASRFLYLAHFGLVILAAYGAQTLFCGVETPIFWRPLNRVLLWMAIGSAGALAVPYLSGQLEYKSWTEWSLLLIILNYPVFRYLSNSSQVGIARLLAVSFVLFDLHAFSVTALNKIDVARKGTDQLERLIGMRGAADFLKAQPGPFRVLVAADPALNIGDAYGIQTLNGGAVTLAANYMDLMSRGGPGFDLLNVRYFLKPAAATDPSPIYTDANWKIFANPSGYPRAWLEPGTGSASVQEYSARHIVVKASSPTAGTLVLSELFYPGWEARVNGTRQRITEVHGGLRGIRVPPGESRVTVDYVPRSVTLGALLSGLTFAFILAAAALWLRP